MVDTVFYEEMADTALELIQQFGRDDLTLTRETPGAYDPATDTEAPGSSMTQSIKCIVLPVSQGVVEAFDDRVENGTLIESNMRLLKIAAKDLAWAPKAGDSVSSFEGSRWIALGATPMNPAGIPLVYSVTVKRG